MDSFGVFTALLILWLLIRFGGAAGFSYFKWVLLERYAEVSYEHRLAIFSNRQENNVNYVHKDEDEENPKGKDDVNEPLLNGDAADEKDGDVDVEAEETARTVQEAIAQAKLDRQKLKDDQAGRDATAKSLEDSDEFQPKVQFSLGEILETYDKKKIRICDAVARKGNHVYVNMVGLILMQVACDDSGEMVLLAACQLAVNCALLAYSYNDSRVWSLAGIMYGHTARIRDGIHGRKNYVMAVVIAGIANIVVWILGLTVIDGQTEDDDQTVLLINYIYFPLTLGDAAGELIGGVWGKQNIRVLGVGEINRKSQLGCFSVWFFSLFPLLALSYLSDTPCSESVWAWLAVTVGFSTTIVEVAAPRSTDNAAIILSNFLWVLLWVFAFDEFDKDPDTCCLADDNECIKNALLLR